MFRGIIKKRVIHCIYYEKSFLRKFKWRKLYSCKAESEPTKIQSIFAIATLAGAGTAMMAGGIIFGSIIGSAIGKTISRIYHDD